MVEMVHDRIAAGETTVVFNGCCTVMWKANGKTTTLQLYLDSLSPKTEKLSLEETVDLSRDRLILELEHKQIHRQRWIQINLLLFFQNLRYSSIIEWPAPLKCNHL
jgi:hypothetical protein